MSPAEKQLPKPKRRWFQLRLRTLLVLVTLAAGAFWWVGWELDQRRREKVAIAWVEKMGGEVTFGSVEKDGFPSETSWWKKTKDILFGESVQSFSLSGDEVTDLSPLAGLENLETLTVTLSAVRDLSPLAGLKNLQALELWGTPASDLSPLAGLTTLQYLQLTGTPASDLSPLAHLKNL
ncbi:hypothetical protein N9B46_05830, partial [Mariniblastus sp.]|nr:hypothetical protein [Mariniblastus sp.]